MLKISQNVNTPVLDVGVGWGGGEEEENLSG